MLGLSCVLKKKNCVAVVQIEEEPEEELAEDDSEDKEDDSEDKEEIVDEEEDEDMVRTVNTKLFHKSFSDAFQFMPNSSSPEFCSLTGKNRQRRTVKHLREEHVTAVLDVGSSLSPALSLSMLSWVGSLGRVRVF